MKGLERIKKQKNSLYDNIHVPIKYARIFELIHKIKMQLKLLSYIQCFVNEDLKENIDEQKIKECENLIFTYQYNFSRIKVTEYCDYHINDYIVQKGKELNKQLLTKCYNDEKEKLYNGIKEIKQSLKEFCDINNNELTLNQKYAINLIFYVIQDNYRSDNALRTLDIIDISDNISLEEENSTINRVSLEVSQEMQPSQFNMMLYEVSYSIGEEQLIDIYMNDQLRFFHQIAVHKYVFDTIKKIKEIIFGKKIEKINELEKLLCKFQFSWELYYSSATFIPEIIVD